jgi:hypothetical protein
MAAGGAGGTPNGQAGTNGTLGTNDYSSTYGGQGGSTPFGQGGAIPPLNAANGNPGGPSAGGSGASAPDRTSPLNWTGGNGGDGYVKLYFGPQADPNYTGTQQYNMSLGV